MDHDRLPNIERPEWDEPREHDGFRSLRARIGRRLGAERLGVSLWELPPGEAAYPYHCHLTEEELVVVLEGDLSLRTPDGWRRLGRGDVVSIPRGEGGAHQILNRGSAPARFLAVSTNGDPDVVLYPDAGKLGVAERLPRGGGLSEYYRREDAVGYWEGVTPPDPA
jgi:uncharacterized cupin superfamily protein